MTTAEKRRQKRKAKREGRRAVKFACAVAVGHGMPVPDPPDFGAPKWTPEQQAANPTKPWTRLVKDVLRVGRWKEGFDGRGKPIIGEYTPEKLTTIFNNAVAMLKSGHAVNIGKNHGDDQLTIATDDLISPIDDIRMENGIIWVSTYVTPAQAAYLENPAMKVSAGLYRDYPSGDGVIYRGPTMLHVAVTDRPVVTGQGPFVALSNYVALGTWDEAKHKRDKGKFTAKGGGGEGKSSAKQAATVAGAAIAINAPHGRAEKAISRGVKKVGGRVLRAGGRIAGRAARKGGEVAGQVARKAGEKAGQAGLHLATTAGRAMIGAAGKHVQKVGTRVAKAGGKAVASGGRAAGNALKSKGVRSALVAGAKRTGSVAGRILRVLAKSPARRAVLRFGNELMPRAIALAATLEKGASAMNLAALLAAINALLEKIGIGPMPDDTNEQNIIPRLEGIALALGAQVEPDGDEGMDETDDAGAEGEIEGAANGGNDGGGGGGAPPIQMSNLLQQVDQRIQRANQPILAALDKLTTAVAGRKLDEEETAQARYTRFESALGKGGVPAGVLASKRKLAAKLDWDTTVLEGLSPTITMASLVSSKGASEEVGADALDGDESSVADKMLEKSDVEARLKEKGIDPKFMP